MKGKWYRSKWIKAFLTALAHILAVILVISMIWILGCPSATKGMLESRQVTYEESEALSMEMTSDSLDIISGLRTKNNLETDGAYDGTKIVDVKKYSDTGVITGKNENGLAYTLDDLKAWAEIYEGGTYGVTEDDPIVVCQKSDKSYEYFYYSDFKQQIDEGKIRFILETEDMTSQNILQQLKEGTWYADTGNISTSAVLDAENKVKYTDCWSYDGFWVEEKYNPAGAASVLGIVNTNPEWNGKLEDAYIAIDGALIILASEFDNYASILETYTEGNTNLTYLYADKDEKKIYTNRAEYGDYDALEDSIETIKASGKYVVVRPKLGGFESNIMASNANDWTHMISESVSADDFVYVAALDTEYPIQDQYYCEKENYDYFSGKLGGMFVAGVVSLALLLIIFIWLTIVAGRRPEDEELHLNSFDRWKTEIAAALVIGVWAGLVMLVCAALDYNSAYYGTYFSTYSGATIYTQSTGLDYIMILLAGLIGFITCAGFLIGYLSLVRRIKARTLWKDSLLRWLLIKMRSLLRQLPIVWKYILVFAGFVFSQFLLWLSGSFVFVMVGLAADVAALIYVVHQAMGKKKIREGIMRIAEGEVDYQIPLEGLRGDQLEIAERINTIGEGLDAAVEASMKNERLKTDLITNVSHDIKTPLTSIINYIDLLKRENIQDEKIQGYLEVLEAKAQRLKNLTEDVVEASKVSSGNISLECMNLNLVEMVQQTSGEFAEKFEKRGLKEVLNLPQEPAVIWADGRRMWRILENIYNNAAKYAMEGTRVYADLKQTGDQVIFSLKNISEQPLNISADELTERFIRGDVSRSTEGSGLGLSIAKNLAELMGGTFELYLDGDLFRVTITFARVNSSIY